MYFQPNPNVRMRFPIIGQAQLPVDHGEALYGAISRLLPEIHAEKKLGISTIEGGYADGSILKIERGGHFYLQISSEFIPILLKLTGQALSVHTQKIRIGVPQLTLINPASNLYARLVTVKGKEDEESLKAFIEQAMNESGHLGEKDSYALKILRRRIIKIHQNKIVAFGVRIGNLPDQLSLWLQENGVGGRRRYGSGFFLPYKEVRYDE